MSSASAKFPNALIGAAALLIVVLAGARISTTPAEARMLHVKPDAEAYPSAVSVTIMQNSGIATTDAASRGVTSDSPPGKIDRPEAAVPDAPKRADVGDPPSERAAAAAARAKRALAEEGNSTGIEDGPVQIDSIAADASTPTAAPASVTGQKVGADQTRKTSAGLQETAPRARGQSATCIAGCY